MSGTLEVDDPYFGDAEGFDHCLAVVERACRGIVEHLGAALPELAGLPGPSEPSALPVPVELPQPVDSRR